MSVRPHLKSFRDWIRQVLFGMCMGAADLVPGISGGTMALILGIYEEFIFSIKSLCTKDAFSIFSFQFKRFNKAVSWDFLLGLIIGIALSFALFSQFIQTALGDPTSRRYLYAIFVGMIIASVMICYARIKTRNWLYLVIFALGTLLTYQATGTRVEPVFNGQHYNVHVPMEKVGDIADKKIRNYDVKQQMLLNVSESNLAAMLARGNIDFNTKVFDLDSGTSGVASDFVTPEERGWIDPWLIFCGAIAISAMLLPGISGSYLLTVLGAYSIAIGALADFIRGGDFDAFIVLCNLGIGIAIGALIFSKVIAFLLENFHDGTLVMLLGFMVGALHTVWPFFTYDYIVNPLKLDKGPLLNIIGIYSPSIFSPELYYGAFVIFLGFIIVYTLEAISKGKLPFAPK